MKHFKKFTLFLLFVINCFSINAQEFLAGVKNDSLTLAKAYINLSLTKTYFDTLKVDRISKILPFEEKELASITNQDFISKQGGLYHFTQSLLYYNKAKLLYRKKDKITRKELVEWHDTLEKALSYFHLCDNKWNTYDDRGFQIYEYNIFYDLINFNNDEFDDLNKKLLNLIKEFEIYFNNDLYTDFKRIFIEAKKANAYDLDELSKIASIYSFRIDKSIQEFKYTGKSTERIQVSCFETYFLDQKLNLISKYFQLKNIAVNELVVPPPIPITSHPEHMPYDPLDYRYNPLVDYYYDPIYNLYNSYDTFKSELKNLEDKDEFFQNELNKKVIKQLFKQLQKKFPYTYNYRKTYEAKNLMHEVFKKPMYFFPPKAPKPSASFTDKNFKNGSTLNQTDQYLKGFLNTAGYKDKLHYYYYAPDGFAITTNLERFNKDGKPISDDKRWTIGNDENFSYYEIFKSIFFEPESNFRMFAFIVASKNVTISNEKSSIEAMKEWIKKSHRSLPEELNSKKIPNQNLTILVYHFHMDENETSTIDFTNEMKVEDYFKNSALLELTK